MGRIVTIAERFVAQAVKLTGTPWVATISIILLLHRILDIVPAGTPADAAVQPVGGLHPRVDGAASNQTPLVHSRSLLKPPGQGSYGSPAAAMARPARVPIAGYPQRAPVRPAEDPPAPRRRQRRRPSTLALSAALHGGARR